MKRSLFFYRLLLQLYPKQYRQRFGAEMEETFLQLYKEAKKNHTESSFWFFLFRDILVSTLQQQRDLIKDNGVKRYVFKTLHLDLYTIIGAVLLLPFFSMVVLDTSVVLLTGDRSLLQGVYHSWLYQLPVIVTWLFVFPASAVVLNTVGLARSAQKSKSGFTFRFYLSHFGSLLVIAAGLFCFAVVALHDFLPCVIHMVLQKGLLQFFGIVQYCRLYS